MSVEHLTRSCGFLVDSASSVRARLVSCDLARARFRYAILVVTAACASPHRSAEVSPAHAALGADGESHHDEPDVATRLDSAAGDVADPPAGAGSGASVTAANACTNAALPPAFEADGSGARAALPASSFDDCIPLDLDGKPPCEVACRDVAPAPDFRSGDDGRSPNFHVLGHTVYFAATTPARQVGRIRTYDGPLDAANPEHAAARTTVVFIDHLTSPPTVELRSGSCLFQCNGQAPLAPRRGTLVGESESDCRAACPPIKRYRYDGKRLQVMR